MTERSRVYFFIAAALSLLVPVPGRLAHVIVLLVLLNAQMVLVTLSFHGINALGLRSMRNVLLVLVLITTTILYKQLLVAVSPMFAMTLGFCLYLPALSTVAIDFFFEKREERLLVHLRDSMAKGLQISAGALVYFLFREAVGYGTISFPAFPGMAVVRLPFTIPGGVFFATIPGNLALIAVLLAALVYARRKLGIAANAAAVRPAGSPEETEAAE